jgi:hypothetical protein
MTKLAQAEKSILFMNNMAGDDLWEGAHLLVKDSPKFEPPHELFKFKSSSRASYNSEGIYLTSIQYSNGISKKLNLYGFPFLPIDVNPSDIEYPTPFDGVIVTQDMRILDYLIEQDQNFRHIPTSHTSRLAWAKGQNLPTVLAVHHAEKHRGSIKDLSRLTGMDIFCPVVWQTGEPTAEFFRKAIKELLASC